MKKLAIMATAAALMLGLPAYAIADNCSVGSDLVDVVIVDHLVLDDIRTDSDGNVEFHGTDVGEIMVACQTNHMLTVIITPHFTETFDDFTYDSAFLKLIVDLVYVVDASLHCTDFRNNDGYTSKKGNPNRERLKIVLLERSRRTHQRRHLR